MIHNAAEYNEKGIEPLIADAKIYLADNSERPWCEAGHYRRSDGIKFTFTDTMWQNLINHTELFQQPYRDAIKFGYGGMSQGKRNGIFQLRKHDNRLIRSAETLTQGNMDEIQEAIGIDNLVNVKMVWHQPNGQRVVGKYNTKNQKMIFLGFANY